MTIVWRAIVLTAAILRIVVCLRCHCTDEVGCVDELCEAKRTAACFHSIEEGLTEEGMDTLHRYGCLPPEAGESAFQCHGHLSSHSIPRSIACCFAYDFCNLDIEPPPYINVPTRGADDDNESGGRISLIGSQLLLVVGVVFVLFVAVLLSAFVVSRLVKRKGKKNWLIDVQARPLISGVKARAKSVEDGADWSSGSGSGVPTLVERNIAHELSYNDATDMVGRGRYGQVYKAVYKDQLVAVKVFFTTEEQAWKREKSIYQIQSFSHECILGYRAAVIAPRHSTTQMLLLTDFHALGSLHDYLKRDPPLSQTEAIQLAHTIIGGMAHLHDAVNADISKPHIAHRDIKSKNILIKAKGVAVIADFGLAVTYDKKTGLMDFGGQQRSDSMRVGTKRYMAPETLDNKINRDDIQSFMKADMYSFGLVLWEIARRTEQVVAQSVRDAGNDSGVAEASSESAPWTAGGGQSSAAMPYKCPYEDRVPSDPSFEAMKEVVVENCERPHIENHWIATGPSLQELTRIMRECWSANPEERLTALRVKVDLKNCLIHLEKQPNTSSTVSQGDTSGKASITV